MRTLFLLFLLFLTNSAMASARIVHPWKSVKLATDNAEIDARTNSDGSRLTWLQVEIGKKSIKAPSTALSEVTNPRLHSIQVMWNCSDATGKVGSQEWRDSCELYVSIEYDNSIDGRTLDEDCPRKSFVFKRGAFVETADI